ncbi:hypothetical protein B0O80DRAFT_437304 [Mortierella sp. GBAus27b]|nr:hypothetical protein B0O80DRAFT_437304 [Mortierella sp. GBAus27b]
MAARQQALPFQIRNPYRLDRPHFDPADVWHSVAEDDGHRPSQSEAEIPSEPCHPSKTSSQLAKGIQRIKDYQRKSAVRGTAHAHRHHAGLSGVRDAPSCNQQQPQISIPTITITHHIDTHAELTFERHVEWLTQTALWWDMPVVHLYPAPKSAVALEHVERAASTFSSWVNFVKIPAGETHPSSVTLPKSATTDKTTRGRTTRGHEGDNPSQQNPGDSFHEGGMVMGHVLETRDTRAPGSTNSTINEIESIVGYVFVGSAEEQAQYQHVFDTMERLFPMIEICYINSFEPTHLQSRQQRELREDPCIHHLSWIHYWSAAKESQVLQSRIVNEVVRARPMWINNDYLHRNYTPPISSVSTPSSSNSPDGGNNLSRSSTLNGGETECDRNSGDYAQESPAIVASASATEADSVPVVSNPEDEGIDRRNGSLEARLDRGNDGHGISHREPAPAVLSRTQSSLDVQDAIHDYRFSGRRLKKWSITSHIDIPCTVLLDCHGFAGIEYLGHWPSIGWIGTAIGSLRDQRIVDCQDGLLKVPLCTCTCRHRLAWNSESILTRARKRIDRNPLCTLFRGKGHALGLF